MFEFIARWMTGRSKQPPTRLSAQEAIAIARRAAAKESLAEHLSMTEVKDRSGRPTWIVTSATVGLMLEVSIDDATGDVLGIRRVGLR